MDAATSTPGRPRRPATLSAAVCADSVRRMDNISPPRAVALVSAGGVVGALARYGLGVAWPHPPHGFPWATWAVNVSGSFLIGVLMTALAHRHPYLRLFLGVGLLGGYTTFATSIVDMQHATPVTAVTYLAATVVGALAAVWAGGTLTRAAVA